MQSSRHLIRREVNSMAWWKISFANHWVTEEELRWVVITSDNPFGNITKEQYKEITGIDFDKEVE